MSLCCLFSTKTIGGEPFQRESVWETSRGAMLAHTKRVDEKLLRVETRALCYSMEREQIAIQAWHSLVNCLYRNDGYAVKEFDRDQAKSVPRLDCCSPGSIVTPRALLVIPLLEARSEGWSSLSAPRPEGSLVFAVVSVWGHSMDQLMAQNSVISVRLPGFSMRAGQVLIIPNLDPGSIQVWYAVTCGQKK